MGNPGRWLEPWYDWKARIKKDNGVALGFFFSFLGQTASDTTDSDDSALGGIYRFNGSWTVLDNAASGELDWDTVQENEYLKALEIGWTPTFTRRKLSKIQFTYWDEDARSGHGWAVCALRGMKEGGAGFTPMILDRPGYCGDCVV